MKLLRLAIAAAILVIPSSAKAEWIYVSSSRTADVYIEDSSINQQQDIVQYSKLDVFAKPLGGRFKKVVSQNAISCSSNTTVTLQSNGFASNGRPLDGNPYTLNRVTDIVPGTVGHAIEQMVCGN